MSIVGCPNPGHIEKQLIMNDDRVGYSRRNKYTFIKGRILVDEDSILMHGEEVVLQLLLSSVFEVTMQASDQ